MDRTSSLDDASERTGLLSMTIKVRRNISWFTLVKLIEVVLACIILWLHYKTFEADGSGELFLITSTYGGFCLIVLGTFLGHVTGHPVNRTMDMLFCVLGFVLYIASGSISINRFNDWNYPSEAESQGLILGSLAIIQGALFVLDAYLIYRITSASGRVIFNSDIATAG